jgi:hypothetical protein
MFFIDRFTILASVVEGGQYGMSFSGYEKWPEAEDCISNDMQTYL